MANNEGQSLTKNYFFACVNTWDIRKKVVCFDITYKVECHWQRNYKPNHKLLFNNLSLETAWHTKPFRQLNSFFVLILSIQVLISNNYENVWPLIRLVIIMPDTAIFWNIFFTFAGYWSNAGCSSQTLDLLYRGFMRCSI